MDEEYDVIVLGTGLKECILSGLMSREGKKVLHIDRNNYYGGKITSLSPLSAAFKHFKTESDLTVYGPGRDWYIDLIPKFLMADGKLVKLLIHTQVTRYLEFLSVEGSYVYGKNAICKVPSSTFEAWNSSLLSLFEKKRFADLLKWAVGVNRDISSTWKTVYSGPKSVFQDSIEVAFAHYKLEDNVKNFVGHAMCLYTDDSYKKVPAIEVIEKIQLYVSSISRYGKSPYLYPLYGLGELPQAFARLSAVYGGTYMLNKPVDEIVVKDGKVVGVSSEGEVAVCKKVICDPTYVPDKVKKVGKVIRAICILSHPVKNTGENSSAQIIIPQTEVGRRNDIYILITSNLHRVCPSPYHVVLVATTVETNDPMNELEPGLRLLRPINQIFYYTDDIYEPTDDGSQSNIFISKSYDASTHFETTCNDVLDMYERITGSPFDFSKVDDKLTEN